MVETNVGLGEAIAGGTRLSGEFGSPISRGLQLNAQMDFQRLQRAQAEQARLQKKQEDMLRFTTFDEGKWNSPQIANEFNKYAKEKMAVVQDLYSKGDKLGAANQMNEIKHELRIKKMVDNGVGSMMKMPTTSVTKGRITEAFNRGGVMGIIEENEKYPFAPIADNIDIESGFFNPVTVKDPNVNRYIGGIAKEAINSVPKLKKIGQQGSTNLYSIDPNDPSYVTAKNVAINRIMSDDDFIDRMVYTNDFKKHYDEYLAAEKIGYNEALESDLNNAVKTFIEKKFEDNPMGRIEKQTPRSGGGNASFNANFFVGGKNSGRWNYQVVDDGYTQVEIQGNPTANPVYRGLDEKNEEITLNYKNPRLRYDPSIGKFRLKGFMDLGNGILAPLPEATISVKEVMSKHGLTEIGLQAYFPDYKPKAAAPKAAGGKTKKDSFPIWKGKNPNGTPAQYKQYLNK
jgi:hypothetical protein